MHYWLCFSLCLVLAGCTIPSWQQRSENIVLAADAAHWQQRPLKTPDFTLQSWTSEPQSGADLTIYIEGDGLAWLNRHRPSMNPTPINPLAFKLALKHPGSNVAYLARPCQFIDLAGQSQCSIDTWTEGRYSDSVIESMDSAISQLKSIFNTNHLILVGFSGGAAVAILVAARRNDVDRIISVAGNLDHRVWTDYHQLQPLSRSLNPADVVAQVDDIPQWHFVGALDEVVPLAVARSYQAKFAKPDAVHIEIIEGFDHQCCWENDWAGLLEKYVFKNSGRETAIE